MELVPFQTFDKLFEKQGVIAQSKTGFQKTGMADEKKNSLSGLYYMGYMGF
ncbi:MAG: hypothetical protein GXP00_13335 [Alphaproteobacteria bacterium]|nr:hypothetical protein [Alphaproteobacteria bacterium]